ncbi:hypothetical protein [Citricoccus muralis]|uniref:Uncharacterized protein n=1 Tax=Citricoccus muralis TaxID=169134 RepID=A0ABY8H956_9MICC|nr:hypothetical protein [Citricoccus muralis]WFP17188.1 hypothetical protein P8192_03420 [Citricoccus muralis]
MEYLVPVLIIAVVALIAVGVGVFISRASKRAGAAGSGGSSAPRKRRGLANRVSPEAAAEASARMDQETHREVYRRIAAGQAAEAAVLYRNATGVGTMDAMFDVQSLASYPQQWNPVADVDPTADDDAADQSAAAPVQDQASAPSVIEKRESTPEVTDLTVPDDWQTEAPSADQPFHVEVVRPEGTVQLSSDELPAWLKDQITALVRDQRVEEAASMLAEHTLLTDNESLDLLRIIAQEQGKQDD